MKLTEGRSDSSTTTSDHAGQVTRNIPSISFPHLSPVRILHESPLSSHDWNLMEHSADSGDTDISDSSPYSVWNSLLIPNPTSQHFDTPTQMDTRVSNFPRLQLPPGYPCPNTVSNISHVYGGDNSIYYDENILQNTQRYVHPPQYAQNVPDNHQNLASIGFAALQDYRRKFH